MGSLVLGLPGASAIRLPHRAQASRIVRTEQGPGCRGFTGEIQAKVIVDRRVTSRAWRPGGNGALNSSAAPSLSAPVPSTVARCSVQAIARSMSDSPQPKKAPPEMPPACGRPENSIRPVLKPEPVDPSKVFHVVGYHDCARLTLLSPAVHRSATGQLENREAGRVGRAGNGTRRPAARHRIKPRTRASTGDPGQEKSQAVIDMRAWLPKPWWRSVAGCKSRPLSLREMPWASAGLRA